MFYLLSFLVTAFAMVLLIPLSERLGLMHAPAGHRAHESPTPLVGGIAMSVGLTVGWYYGGADISLIGTSVLLVFCGVWDDVQELSSTVRFLFQVVACGAMIYWGDVVLADLGYLSTDDWPVYLGRWAVALTIFGTVGVINSINMSDGMDGLAGCIALIPALVLLMFTYYADVPESVHVLGVFVCVIVGFLFFNLRGWGGKPARVFMGDAGSMVLGFVLSWYLIKHSQGPDKLYPPVLALWLIALPLFDAVGVLIRRTLKGSSPFKADRKHYHHYLLSFGLSVNQVLAVVVVTATSLALLGVVGFILGVPDRTMLIIFLLLFFLYLIVLEYFDRKVGHRTT